MGTNLGKKKVLPQISRVKINFLTLTFLTSTAVCAHRAGVLAAGGWLSAENDIVTAFGKMVEKAMNTTFLPL